MKQIDLYLIEKLKINKDIDTSSKMYGIEWVKTDIPVCDWDEQVLHKSEVWKTLEMPKSKYVIFNDMYRNGRPHLADTGDFFCAICFAQDDYEDFNPEKDILYASNDLKEILEWYFNYLGIDEFPKDEDDIDEWEENYRNNLKHKINDNLHVLAEFYLGVDNSYDNCKEFTFSKNELLEQIGSYFDVD